MNRHGKAKLQQATSSNNIVEPRADATPSAPRSHTDPRRVRKEEQWDADSLDALRGYTSLSRDATTAGQLNWRHLKHENKEEVLDRPDTTYSSDDTESRPGTPDIIDRKVVVSLRLD
jgi:hypothetical protein